MEEIIRFVLLAQTDRFTIADLGEQFGISRKTAHKHLERYAAGGVKALQPRSHRPHACPHRTDDHLEQLVLAERRLHRTWGPKCKKIAARADRDDGVIAKSASPDVPSEPSQTSRSAPIHAFGLLTPAHGLLSPCSANAQPCSRDAQGLLRPAQPLLRAAQCQCGTLRVCSPVAHGSARPF